MREKLNEYGSEVGEFTCASCGDVFTVCPRPKPDHVDQWKGCLAPKCASYDPNRDAEVLFTSDKDVAKLPVVGIDMLRAPAR